ILRGALLVCLVCIGFLRLFLLFFFFFSSRRRHTRFSRDWSSDVCSSDLQVMQLAVVAAGFTPGDADNLRRSMGAWRRKGELERRSEERRVGKECRSRWSACQSKKKREKMEGEEVASAKDRKRSSRYTQ